MGFSWDFHGNGSNCGLLIEMGMGMGIVLTGIGIAYFIGENKIPIHIHRFIITQNVAHLSRNMLLSNYLFIFSMHAYIKI